jgi:hypothetical protein
MLVSCLWLAGVQTLAVQGFSVCAAAQLYVQQQGAALSQSVLRTLKVALEKLQQPLVIRSRQILATWL